MKQWPAQRTEWEHVQLHKHIYVEPDCTGTQEHGYVREKGCSWALAWWVEFGNGEDSVG